MTDRKNTPSSIIRLIIFSGFIGGMAEVLFMLFYSFVSKGSLVVIGSEITKSFFKSYEAGVDAALLGLLIHFLLAFVVSFFFITVIMPLFNAFNHPNRIMLMSLVYLAMIWCLNFLILLPKVNVAFVHLFPYMVTFASKLLFGYSMSVYLSRNIENDHQATTV